MGGRSSRATSLGAFRYLLIAAAFATAADAQPAPLGPETLVEAASTCCIGLAEVAGRRDGSYLVLYERRGEDGRTQGVVRRGDSAGDLGAPLAAYDFANGFGRATSLVPTPGGYTLVLRVGLPHRTLQLDANGVPRGPTVHLGRADLTVSPRLVGGLVASWTSWPRLVLNAQCLGRSARPPGKPGRVHGARLPGPDDYALSHLAHFADGSFIIAWGTNTGPLDGWQDEGTFAHRFDAHCRPVGTTFQILPPHPGFQGDFRIAGGGDGVLAVISAVSRHGEFGEVELSTFDRDGHRLGGPFAITVEGFPWSSYPRSLVVDPDGNVLAVWEEKLDFQTSDVFARVFSRDLAPMGEKFPLRSAASAELPLIWGAEATWSGDAWVIAWGTAATRMPFEASRVIWVRRFARPR